MKVLTVALVALIIWTGILSGWVFGLEDRIISLEFWISSDQKEIRALNANLAKQKLDARKSSLMEQKLEKAFIALVTALTQPSDDDKPSKYDKTMNSPQSWHYTQTPPGWCPDGMACVTVTPSYPEAVMPPDNGSMTPLGSVVAN